MTAVLRSCGLTLRHARLSIAIASLLASSAAFADGWKYRAEADEMTDKTRLYATVYGGKSATTRSQKGKAPSAALSISRDSDGRQSALLAYRDELIECKDGACDVLVRFDDGEAKKFRVRMSRLGVAHAVVFVAQDDFIEQVKSASTIRVRIQTYPEGMPTLVFKAAAPLLWPPDTWPVAK